MEHPQYVGNVKFGLHGDTEAALAHIDRREPGAGFVHLFHPGHTRPTDSLSRIAWNDDAAKEFLVELTNRGYFTYMSHDGESRLVHESRLTDLWTPLRDGQFEKTADGVIHQYAGPLSGERPRKLLIIFSSVFDPALSSSLARYFNRTFLTIQKYLPHDVGVLRVADFGGVLGAFYMNTRRHPANEERISRFLTSFIADHDLGVDDVVLYGASKGGTASLAYGLRHDLKFIAVDPIVDDTYYHEVHNDLHFTKTDIFLRSKAHMFDEVYRDFTGKVDRSDRSESRVSRAVICSEGSPLFPYLERSAIAALREHVSFFKSHNPNITTHPGVAQNTINILTMLLNAYFYRQSFPVGVIDVE